MGKCLFMRKGETHTEPKVGLPSGYTKLEYVESTGTQYVDTGYKPGSGTTLYAEVSITTLPSSGSAFILGARTASGSGRFSLYVNGGDIGFGYNTTTNIVTSVSAPTTKTSISIAGNVCTFGGVSKTATASTFTTTYNLSLFAENRMGTISENSSYKLYSCQIYDNGTLVRDFIPCINPSGEIGLYDTVNKKFYGNAGTGAFIGSEVAA